MRFPPVIKPGKLSIFQAADLNAYLQDIDRYVRGASVTPPLYKTENRIGVNIDGLAAQLPSSPNWILAQITGISRYTTTQPTPPAPFPPPMTPPTPSSYGSSSGSTPIEGGQGMGVAGAGSTGLTGSDFAPIYQYSWIPVTPGPQGGVLPLAAPGSGQFLQTTGISTNGTNTVNLASVTGLQIGQMFIPNTAFPNSATIISINAAGLQVVMNQNAVADGTETYNFIGAGPAFEANGYVVPVGQVVRLWPGYVDLAVGQTYLFDGADRPLPAQITGGSNPYSWSEVTPALGGVFTVPTGNNFGTATFQPAYERNGDTKVIAGKNVLLWRSIFDSGGTAQNWVFDSSPTSTTSGGGGLSGNCGYTTGSLVGGGAYVPVLSVSTTGGLTGYFYWWVNTILSLDAEITATDKWGGTITNFALGAFAAGPTPFTGGYDLNTIFQLGTGPFPAIVSAPITSFTLSFKNHFDASHANVTYALAWVIGEC